MKNRFATFCLFLLLFSLPASTVYSSGFPVVDIAGLIQSVQGVINQISQISNQVSQINNQLTQVTQLYQQIDNQVQSLQTLGSGGSFSQLKNDLTGQLNGLDSIMGRVAGIEFTANNITSQFYDIFPDVSILEGMSISQYNDVADDWNKQITDATSAAMQAQGTVQRIKNNNQRIAAILGQAEGADGEVRQLQLSNEMLSVLGGQLNDMNQVLATSGRVVASSEAKIVAQEEAMAAASRRLRANYAYPGAPAIKRTTFLRIPY